MYDTLREQVSLLLSEGHASARRYPVGMVWHEAAIVIRRINSRMVTESLLQQAMLGGVLNGKKGAKHYTEMIKGLNRG